MKGRGGVALYFVFESLHSDNQFFTQREYIFHPPNKIRKIKSI